MTDNAKHAIKAARNYDRWGIYATRRYLEKRQVPISLYWLARKLEIVHRMETFDYG